MNYKTVRELASEFNISKQAIYKKINYSMKNELKDHIVKENKTTYITQKGESIIFNSLKEEVKENIDKNIKELEVRNQINDEFSFLSMLENQLDNLKKENKKLKEINKDLNYKLYVMKIENMKLKQSQSNKYFHLKFIKDLFNKTLIKH